MLDLQRSIKVQQGISGTHSPPESVQEILHFIAIDYVLSKMKLLSGSGQMRVLQVIPGGASGPEMAWKSG